MKLIKTLFKIIILCVFIFVGVKVYDGYKLYKEAIEQVSLQTKVKEIKEKNNYTAISEMPDIYIKAVVAVEDHRFYDHNGIDLISIGRAIINDIKAMSFVEGGSSITQQLAKNMYFTQDKNITRKIAEIFMAFEMENNLSKNELLELYLNTSYFGAGCYTVKDAARTYFGKEPIEMTDYESTMLAGIPNAPSVYAPTVNPELAKERQKQVLQKMVQHGVISEEKSKEILESRLGDVH